MAKAKLDLGKVVRAATGAKLLTMEARLLLIELARHGGEPRTTDELTRALGKRSVQNAATRDRMRELLRSNLVERDKAADTWTVNLGAPELTGQAKPADKKKAATPEEKKGVVAKARAMIGGKDDA